MSPFQPLQTDPVGSLLHDFSPWQGGTNLPFAELGLARQQPLILGVFFAIVAAVASVAVVPDDVVAVALQMTRIAREVAAVSWSCPDEAVVDCGTNQTLNLRLHSLAAAQEELWRRLRGTPTTGMAVLMRFRKLAGLFLEVQKGKRAAQRTPIGAAAARAEPVARENGKSMLLQHQRNGSREKSGRDLPP